MPAERNRKPKGRIPLWAGLLVLPIAIVLAPVFLVLWWLFMAAAVGADLLESLIDWVRRDKDKT